MTVPCVCAKEHAHASPVSDGSRCDFQYGACAKNISNLEVTLDIAPKPVKAMKELLFSVVVKGGKRYDSLVLDLTMPGMYMGANKVILKRSADGIYTGKGIIPKCPSGKKFWSASIDFPGKGSVEFFFDVVY